MKITLTNAGKRYNREWIFRHVHLELYSGKRYAITGANGSGKSTLLQVLAGAITCSEGQIAAHNSQRELISDAQLYRQISMATPYLELIEEMTAAELLAFHHLMKPLTATATQMLNAVQLEPAMHKQIRYYSSGMKQRLKLALAFFCDTPVLLLDEPTANLDNAGVAIYQHLLEHYTQNRLVIIGSNEPIEYPNAHQVLKMEDYKTTLVHI